MVPKTDGESILSRIENLETAIGSIEKNVRDNATAIENVQEENEELKKQNNRVWSSINKILTKLDTQERAQERTDVKVDDVKTAIGEIKTQVTRNSAQQEIYMNEISGMNTWLREQHAGKSAAAVALEQSREETRRVSVSGFWEWTKVITTSGALIIGAIAAFIKIFL